MAEPRPILDEAVERLARTDDVLAANVPLHHDPVVDAVALAAAADGAAAREPDPEVEAGLEAAAAVVAASGLMAWRVRLTGRWRSSLTGALVTRTSAGPAAVLPGPGPARIVDAVTRHTRRLDRRTASDIDPDAMALARELPADARWWRLLVWSLGQRRGDVWLLLALGVVGGLAGLLLPLATGAIFQSAVPSGEVGRIVAILVAFAVGSAGAGVVLLARGLLVVRLRDRSDMALAPAVVARLLRLRAAFFRERTAGDVINRALSVDAARQQVDDSVLAAIVTAAFGLVNLVYLLAADPMVGLVSAATTVAALAVSLTVQLRARALLPRLLEARSRSDATLLSLLTSLVSWRVAGAEDRALARWAVDQGESTAALDARLRGVSLTGPIDVAGPLVVIVAFVLAVILIPGSTLRPGSTTAPGTFLALYAAVAQLSIALIALSNQIVVLSELGPVLSRLQPIVAAPRERERPTLPPGRLLGAVELSGVSFGYRPDQPPLFEGFDLAIAPGEFVAVVGPSGGGKSTLLRLILGFEEPWRGTVAYDGHDLAELDPAAVRRQLGVVLQSSRPLGATVRESVAGPRRLDDGHVWELLEEAGLDADVREMPGGLEASVGDHGILLSGGQRQRLMIARALAGDPRILLLDEATSALDNLTQSVVMRTILSCKGTRIVVAHRMSTVREADRVVVVDHGRIVEDGPPDVLLAADGHFARLARRQEL